MRLYRYSLWNFEGKESKDRKSDDYSTFIRVASIENAVIMPNAFYLPLMNNFEVLPIGRLGCVTVIRTPSLKEKYKEEEYLYYSYDLYLPYMDFTYAKKEFAKVLKESGYPKQAKCVSECTMGSVHRNTCEFDRSDIAFLKKYDMKMGPRDW